MLHKKLCKFLAKSQQELRQQDRFGDIQVRIAPKPPQEIIKSLEELIINFAENPDENIDLLLKQADVLQYIPLEFVEQLSQTNFYNQLIEMLTRPDQTYKILYIIAAAISPISSFTSPIFQNISIDRHSLFEKFYEENLFRNIQPNQNLNQNLPFLSIISEFMSTFSIDFPDIITATTECVRKILSIQTKHMKIILSRWKEITDKTLKRIHKDMSDLTLFHHDIRLLIQIIENPNINSVTASDFAQRLVITGPLSDDLSAEQKEKFICDSLVLLSGICYHLARFNRSFANEPLTKQLISLLKCDSIEIKLYTINAILEICSGMFPEPIDLLYEQGLFELLINFIEENPDKADRAFNVATIICKFGPGYVEMVCESGMVDAIFNAVREGAYDVQLSAIYLVSNILFFGSYVNIAQVTDQDIFSTMMELVEEDCIGADSVLDSINHALDAEREGEDLTLKNFLSNQDFFTIIENLEGSEDQTTAELAQAIHQKLESKLES